MFLRELKLLSVVLFCVCLCGCAGLTPKNQTNTFSSPPALPELVLDQDRKISDAKSDVERVGRQIQELKQTQETNQASINSLLGVNNLKLTGIQEAHANLAADIAAVKNTNNVGGDLTALKAQNADLTAKFLDATSATFALRAEVSGLRYEVTHTNNQNSGRDSIVNYIPQYVWWGGVGMVTLIVLSLIGVIFTTIKNRRDTMKTREEMVQIKSLMEPRKKYTNLSEVPPEGLTGAEK
jgi:hypothetical protein